LDSGLPRKESPLRAVFERFSRKPGGISYGWLIVATMTLVMTMVYGASFSFSVFLKPLSEWFGWERASTSGAYAVSLWTSGLLAVLMGVLTDRYGPRIVLAIGGLLGGLGYLILSGTSALWQLYAGFAVIAVNTSATWTPITATVSRWFSDKRVLALGIATGGIGLGQMVMPPLVTYLIGGTDWRTAYLVLAFMTWGIVIPAALPAKHSPTGTDLPSAENGPEDTPLNSGAAAAVQANEWSLTEAVRTPTFWLLVGLNITVAITLFMAGIHIAAYATDVGITASSAALVLTVMGGANIMSKLFVGTIATRYGSRFSLLLFLALGTIALFIFAGITELWMFFAVAALFGFGIGGAAPPLAAMVAEYFGLRSVGVIMGVIGVGWAAGCSIGTILGDYLFDTGGSYVVAFLVAGGLSVLALLFVLLLQAPRKSDSIPSIATS
jgi:OFA family oxalate/formate antiporter-like MFS transporter